MSEMMRGIALNEDQKLELIKVPVPEPKKGYVRVKVERAGICASDVGYWQHGSERLILPVILGHEGAGVVDKLGEDVSKVKKGDRVIVMTTYEVCGECKFCKMDSTNLCINRLGIGSKKNGLFAEYVEVPETSCIIMPDNLSFEEAALTEVLACSIHAVAEQSPVKFNDLAVIMGPGPIGMTAALAAKAMGARVVLAGLNQDEARFKVGKELGIEHCVNQEKEDLEKYVRDLTDGYGADFVVEAAGVYPSLKTAFKIVRAKGTISQMGVFHGEAPMNLYPMHQKEINYIGSLSQVPSAWIKARDAIADGRINVKPLVSDTLPLEQFEEAFEAAANVTGFKILFNPQAK